MSAVQTQFLNGNELQQARGAADAERQAKRVQDQAARRKTTTVAYPVRTQVCVKEGQDSKGKALWWEGVIDNIQEQGQRCVTLRVGLINVAQPGKSPHEEFVTVECKNNEGRSKLVKKFQPLQERHFCGEDIEILHQAPGRKQSDWYKGRVLSVAKVRVTKDRLLRLQLGVAYVNDTGGHQDHFTVLTDRLGRSPIIRKVKGSGDARQPRKHDKELQLDLRGIPFTVHRSTGGDAGQSPSQQVLEQVKDMIENFMLKPTHDDTSDTCHVHGLWKGRDDGPVLLEKSGKQKKGIHFDYLENPALTVKFQSADQKELSKAREDLLAWFGDSSKRRDGGAVKWLSELEFQDYCVEEYRQYFARHKRASEVPPREQERIRNFVRKQKRSLWTRLVTRLPDGNPLGSVLAKEDHNLSIESCVRFKCHAQDVEVDPREQKMVEIGNVIQVGVQFTFRVIVSDDMLNTLEGYYHALGGQYMVPNLGAGSEVEGEPQEEDEFDEGDAGEHGQNGLDGDSLNDSDTSPSKSAASDDPSQAFGESYEEYPNVGLPGIVGVRNIGNTCFMDACLQCLLRLPPIMDALQPVAVPAAEDTGDMNLDPGQALTTYLALWMHKISNPQGGPPWRPSRSVVNALAGLPEVSGGGVDEDSMLVEGIAEADVPQTDAHEFMVSLLGRLHNPSFVSHSEHHAAMNLAAINIRSSCSWRELYTYHCEPEQHEKNSSPTFFVGPVLVDMPALDQADCSLEVLLSTQFGTFNVVSRCESCGDKDVQFTGQRMMQDSPKCLIITVARSQLSGRSDTRHVPFTASLTEGLLGRPESGSGHRSYDLCGVVVHRAPLFEFTASRVSDTDGGHFIAFVRNRDSDDWYQIDDDSVLQVTWESVMSQTAYMLFYLRRDATLGPEEVLLESMVLQDTDTPGTSIVLGVPDEHLNPETVTCAQSSQPRGENTHNNPATEFIDLTDEANSSVKVEEMFKPEFEAQNQRGSPIPRIRLSEFQLQSNGADTLTSGGTFLVFMQGLHNLSEQQLQNISLPPLQNLLCYDQPASVPRRSRRLDDRTCTTGAVRDLLNPEQMVNDHIIDLVGSMLQDELIEFGVGDGAIIFDSYFTRTIQNGGVLRQPFRHELCPELRNKLTQIWNRRLQDNDRNTRGALDILLFPTCSEGHWTLLVGYPQQRMLRVMDPFSPGAPAELVTRIAHVLAAFLQEMCGPKSSTPWKVQLQHVAPVQNDSVSCGVIMLAFLLFLTSRIQDCKVPVQELATKEQLDMVSFFETVFGHSPPQKSICVGASNLRQHFWNTILQKCNLVGPIQVVSPFFGVSRRNTCKLGTDLCEWLANHANNFQTDDMQEGPGRSLLPTIHQRVLEFILNRQAFLHCLTQYNPDQMRVASTTARVTNGDLVRHLASMPSKGQPHAHIALSVVVGIVPTDKKVVVEVPAVDGDGATSEVEFSTGDIAILGGKDRDDWGVTLQEQYQSCIFFHVQADQWGELRKRSVRSFRQHSPDNVAHSPSNVGSTPALGTRSKCFKSKAADEMQAGPTLRSQGKSMPPIHSGSQKPPPDVANTLHDSEPKAGRKRGCCSTDKVSEGVLHPCWYECCSHPLIHAASESVTRGVPLYIYLLQAPKKKKMLKKKR